MRRLTIFDELGRSPSSGTSRSLVTASSGYGLTLGGYTAEFLQLTESGEAIVAKNDPKEKVDAVLGVGVFASFFEHYKNASIPSATAAGDFLKSQGISPQSIESCLEILLQCGEQVALIQEISGQKRIVSTEHAIETLSKGQTYIETTKPTPKPEPELERPVETPVTPSAPIIKQSSDVPVVHIDIQIHIDANAKPEQIEKIFEMMAKYLYKK